MKNKFKNLIMKLTKIITAIIISTIMISSSCKKNETKSLVCYNCKDATFVQDFKNINGTIKKVSTDDYFFNGNKFYLSVDTELQLPEFFKNNPNQKIIKLFSCLMQNYTNDDLEKTVTISGKLYNCTTGNHGRLTNDLHTFQIFN